LKVPDSIVPEVLTGRSHPNRSPSSLKLDNLEAAKRNSDLMFKTVIERNDANRNSFPFLDIPTILLAILIRSEAHEYTLARILGRIQTETGDQMDIPDLLSVERKERREFKGKETFRPDTRAIRDATAHAKFVIKNDPKGDYVINFQNDGDGYTYI
jgi:hypothetical protein